MIDEDVSYEQISVVRVSHGRQCITLSTRHSDVRSRFLVVDNVVI